MRVVEYDKKYKNDFKELNLAWINALFELEDEDNKVFKSIEDYIRKGANVFFTLGNKLTSSLHEKALWYLRYSSTNSFAFCSGNNFSISSFKEGPNTSFCSSGVNKEISLYFLNK